MDKLIVQTKTFFSEDVKEELLELTKSSFEIFTKQSGLISIQTSICRNDNHITTYFEWESEEAHKACMQSSDFEEWNETWQRLIEEGKIEWELNTYEVLKEFSSSHK